MLCIALTILACTSPQPKLYTLSQPIAQTGPQHLLLGQKIDINTATATTLEALPGVGPSLASAIVTDRTQHGPFHSVADLNRVRGVGDKLLAKLAPYVRATSKE